MENFIDKYVNQFMVEQIPYIQFGLVAGKQGEEKKWLHNSTIVEE